MKQVVRRLLLPLATAALVAILFRSVYFVDGQYDWMMLWLLVGIPFGLPKFFLCLVPRGMGIGETVGLFVLCILLSAILGGLVFLWQIFSGVFYAVKMVFDLLIIAVKGK